MAARHLRDLIAAYGEKDDLKFRRAAQGIIHEEENRRHTVVAKELRQLLAAAGSVTTPDRPALEQPPVDRDSSLPLGQVTRPERALRDLVLGEAPAATLKHLVEEVRRWPELDAANIPRRNRVLLYGPPGCGKTSAVEAVARELKRPLLTARVEGLVSSYLGETAANLRNLFEFASAGSYVLFFDEFDSLGKMRDDPSDHGELRRVVNAVLQQIDSYRGSSLIFAATNHPQVLDTALWRRFSIVQEMPYPTASELVQVLAKSLPPKSRGLAIEFGHELVGLPHAAAEFAVNSARRRSVLRGAAAVESQDMTAAISEVRSRPWA